MKILFVSDFFSEQIIGGAEKNDEVLLKYLSKHYDVVKVNSQNLTLEQVNNNEYFILSNFVNVSDEILLKISTKKYIVYEHDHKYTTNRDPSKFINFNIPKNKIVNKFLYKRASKVFVLSSICKKILEENLKLNNVINIGTSLWSDEDLNKLQTILESNKTRNDKICILHSENPIKGYNSAVTYCAAKNLETDIIFHKKQEKIWQQMRSNVKFMFLPKTLETFSRVTCEAKMLGCKVLTTPAMIGYFSENIDLEGLELILEIKDRISNALASFHSEIELMKKNNKTICFIGKFDEIYDEEGKALALEEAGFRVVRFEENLFNRSLDNSKALLFDANPDFVFFTKLRIPNKLDILNTCKRKKIKTICWVPDLYFGIDREIDLQNDIIFKSDYVFTPDGGNNKRFKELGINHFCIRQGISKKYLNAHYEKKDLDIVFIGTIQKCHQPFRGKMLSYLEKKYGNRFHWFGKSGDREIRNKQLEKVYSRSKIVIGDSVESEKYWSNRIYESLGRNCFIIHPNIKGLLDLFSTGVDIEIYEKDNLASLGEKIDYYLDNEKKIIEIANNGFNLVKNRDLLYHRALEIKEIIL